jgi:toxin CcdB
LLPPDQAPKPAGRLNPSFDIRGEQYVMVTQYAAALESNELGPKIASLTHRDHEIVNALDVLITGV